MTGSSRRLLIASAVVIMLALFVAYFFAGRTSANPQQPVDFSHQRHVEQRGIACAYCHTGATVGLVAGIPPVETCMGCHAVVGGDNPDVLKLREHWEQQEPIRWARLTYLPDHVVFAHSPHVNADFDCLGCHARGVSSQDWFPSFAPGMAWCLSCHEQQNAPIDCWTCHK